MAEVAARTYSTPVADDWNWTARIRSELGANKAWQRKWGFLLQDHTKQQQTSQLRQSTSAATAAAASNGPKTAPAATATALTAAAAAAAAAAGGDALSTFMQQAEKVPTNYIAAKQRDSLRAKRMDQQSDALDGFVSNYMAKSDPRARRLPAEEFRKPLTTSHEYGWGRNLEVFGSMALVMK